jgi:hypothetical protein
VNLTRDHLGKIVRLDAVTVVAVPEGVFKMGDIVVLFNNTDKGTTVQSALKKSYRSGLAAPKAFFEVPPRALVNLIFVADDTLVFTVGL